jgi:hypothetical protein
MSDDNRVHHQTHSKAFTRETIMAKVKPFCIPGQKITIKANKAHGFPAERGKYLGTSGKDMHIVGIDKKYRSGPGDDGLREVHTGQIKELDPS